MKKIISKALVLIYAVLMLACSPRHDGFIVKGEINGAPNGTIVTASKMDIINRSQEFLDSAIVSDGRFEMIGKIVAPDEVYVMVGEFGRFKMFVENTEISISLSVDDYKNEAFHELNTKITGSPLNDLHNSYQQDLDAIMNADKYTKLNELDEAYGKASQARDGKQQERIYKELSKLQNLTDERLREIKALQMNFVNKYPDSPVGPSVIGYSFGERSMTVDEMADLLTKFGPEAKKTAFYKNFEKEYTDIIRTRPGSIAPEFTLRTPMGGDLAFRSTRGKYVLLDFWASWCKPCRASYPHLKEVYSKYKDAGFEVFAVSTDSNHDAWKKAIEEDETKWIQVVDTFSKPRQPADISTLYAVPYLPTTFLIDPDGVILAKNLHEDELDKKLEEIFGF